MIKAQDDINTMLAKKRHGGEIIGERYQIRVDLKICQLINYMNSDEKLQKDEQQLI